MKRIQTNGTYKALGVLLVVAVVACGLVLPQSASAAPPAPNWLPGQPMLAGNQIIAMWLPVPGATKYILYMNGEKIAESPANQFMGLAPEKGGEYKYQVRAVDGSGAEGPLSKPGTIKIVLITPPTELMVRPDHINRTASLR